MKFKKITLIALLYMLPQLSLAAPSINDMQTCQGLLDFIDDKLNPAPAKYGAEDVKAVRKGFDGYNQYIQTAIVSPGLLKFTGGDKAKADELQTQVDAYKKQVVEGFKKRYPQDRLFYDQAIAVNNCAKKAVPSGQALEDLKLALNTLVKLTQMK